MQKVRAALLEAYIKYDDLKNLPLAVGAKPAREPPGEEAIDQARKLVAQALGVPMEERNIKHPAGKWRARLVQAVHVHSNLTILRGHVAT